VDAALIRCPETARCRTAGPSPLGAVELHVGALDPQRRRRAHPLRRESAADADADTDLLRRADRHGHGFDAPAHALGHRFAEGGRAVGHDDGELLAADPGHHVHGPHALEQRLGHGLDHQVAAGMAVCVVHLLEVVDVKRQQQRRLAGTGDPVDLARQRQLEAAAVRQSGERVTAGQIHQRIDQRLQPRVAARLAGRQVVPCLAQQLQRRVELQRSGGGTLRGRGACHRRKALEGVRRRSARAPSLAAAPTRREAR
jgi:hypothetical protein